MRSALERAGLREQESVEELAEQCRRIKRPLRTAADLDPLLERIGEARYVLLGEASHGTSEYYVWRMWLSQRLIREKGFSFIAVEGDWPDCYCVNRFVKGYNDAGDTAREALKVFDRWPTWMWANWEVAALAEWLRDYNAGLSDERKAGFYGLDVYSLWESMNSVIQYLEQADGSAVEAARQAYRCFEPYRGDVQEYARATSRFVPANCEREALEMLVALRRGVKEYAGDGREAQFAAEQNALVVKNAEAYYRTMMLGGPDSWNVRDTHMAETLERLMKLHGPEAKAIVWEHNTHIGDARATDMAEDGMVNVGQLVREAHGPGEVFTAGFGSYKGSVIAGDRWGAPMERMEVPEARPGSWEDTLHRTGTDNKLILTAEGAPIQGFAQPRGHRAIGVVYDPEFERYGNYVPTVLPARYDALLYVERSRALHPFHLDARSDGEPPGTYPWNV